MASISSFHAFFFIHGLVLSLHFSEMGFGGKAKVCRGKPANHSILLVKFMPTFSGLQEAERLHKYLDEKKRGRKEWLQFSIGSKLIDTKVVGEDVEGRGKVEQLFYGYLALAEDLIKLDFESKRRSVVKSKREIVAIVGASMNGERLAQDVLVG